MDKKVATFINQYKQYFSAVVKLLGSGAIAALGFVLLSSGMINYIPNHLSVKILLFIQYHMIGVIIAKYGVDFIVYTRIMDNQKKIYDPFDYLKKQGVLLSLLCAVVYGVMNGYEMAIVIFFTIMLDIYSIITIVEMNAIKRYNQALIANIMGYPLFFLILFATAVFWEYGYLQTVLLYAVCILIRFLITWRFIASQKKKMEQIEIKVPFNIGIQQVLNYNLFNMDRVMLSMGEIVMVLGVMEEDIQQMIFLSKFPELVSSILVSLSFLYAPHLIVRSRDDFGEKLKKYRWYALLYFFCLSISFGVYLFIWRGKEALNVVYILAYLMIPFLTIFANMISLGYIKADRIKQLVNNLAVSCGVGFLLLGVFYLAGIGSYMMVIVPIQLFIFLILRLKDKV